MALPSCHPAGFHDAAPVTEARNQHSVLQPTMHPGTMLLCCGVSTSDDSITGCAIPRLSAVKQASTD